MARRRAEHPPLPPPKPAARLRSRRPPDPDAYVDGLEPGEVGGDELNGRTRRMAPGDRQQAELAAALRAKMTGQPVFPYPAELHSDHKPYWVETVNSKPHDYFNAGDIHLLKLYCRVAADIDRLDREIAEEGSVILNNRGNPIVNPRIVVRSLAETRLLSLSTKLRLQPSARYDSENDRKQSDKKRNADRAARVIEDEDDGDGLIARGPMQ